MIRPSILYLASQSPRRADLLRQMGLRFKVVNPQINECQKHHESTNDYVVRLACQKARAGKAMIDDSCGDQWVIGADTIVVKNQTIFGKPRDLAQAVETLMLLSDTEHSVFTAVAVVDAQNCCDDVLIETRVKLGVITEHEAERYWHTGEPIDKAGGYAIQGRAAIYVESITGSYSSVVGLPLYQTRQLLLRSGYPFLSEVGL